MKNYNASDEMNENKLFIKKRLSALFESVLNEERYSDLFEFLDRGARKMTQGSVQYVYLMRSSSMNKNLVTPEGKVPNPMYGKLYKHCFYKFNWKDTFQRAAERMGLNLEPGQRRGTYERLKAYDMLETGKSGLYLPILPTGSNSVYATLENDNFIEVPKEEAFKYLKGYTSTGEKPEYRQLIINKDDGGGVIRISAGGNEWINPKFRFNYIGPTNL